MKKYGVLMYVFMLCVAVMSESAPIYIILGHVVSRHPAFMWASEEGAKGNSGLCTQEDSNVLQEVPRTILSTPLNIPSGYCTMITVANTSGNTLGRKRVENLVVQPLSSGGALVAIGNKVSMPQIMWTDVVNPSSSAKECTFITLFSEALDDTISLEKVAFQLTFTGTVQSN